MHYFLRAIKHGTAPWWFGMHPAGLKKVIIRKSENEVTVILVLFLFGFCKNEKERRYEM